MPTEPLWHVMLHARPGRPPAPRGVTVRGRSAVSGWDELSATEQTAPFPVAFEAAAADLSRLPNLYFEPDGSFCWVGPRLAWQFGGQLTDYGGRLVHVELRGHGTPERWQALATAVAGPGPRLAVQLVEAAVYLDWDDFLALVDGDGGPTPSPGIAGQS